MPTLFAEKRVSVKGYYRKDGMYVRPHYRSAPDGDKSNNYGSASSQQRQQYRGYTTLPSYNNDYDNDGTANRNDKDDDNDDISDNSDSSQYGRSSSNTYMQPSYSSKYETHNSGQTKTIYSNGQFYQATPQSDGSYIIKDSFGNTYRYDGENE